MSEQSCRCAHPLSQHCKGKVSHTNYKEDARMKPSEYRKMNRTCETRHCLQPLCDCIDYREATA